MAYRMQDESYSITRCSESLEWESSPRHGEGAGYLMGYIRTPDGIVSAYSQRGDRDYTTIGFIWKGRDYRRYYHERAFTKRGLAIIAGRFAKAITGRRDA